MIVLLKRGERTRANKGQKKSGLWTDCELTELSFELFIVGGEEGQQCDHLERAWRGLTSLEGADKRREDTDWGGAAIRSGKLNSVNLANSYLLPPLLLWGENNLGFCSFLQSRYFNFNFGSNLGSIFSPQTCTICFYIRVNTHTLRCGPVSHLLLPKLGTAWPPHLLLTLLCFYFFRTWLHSFLPTQPMLTMYSFH